MTDTTSSPDRSLAPDHHTAGDAVAIERRIDELFAISRRHAEAAREAFVEAMELQRLVDRPHEVDLRR
ncbi:MAG: hypothetical protein MUE36_05435 [Acidimicrobiales bacterium]|jgi:hypothetical protein|nr:hypothetical protein [Acidimicrobiales bacterium]